MNFIIHYHLLCFAYQKLINPFLIKIIIILIKKNNLALRN